MSAINMLLLLLIVMSALVHLGIHFIDKRMHIAVAVVDIIMITMFTMVVIATQ